jgi:hypothetical protein
MLERASSWVLVAVLASGCGSAEEPAAVVGEAQAATRFFVSASTIEALDGSLASVKPAVEELFPADPLLPEDYLKPMSCLGYYGPIGPWGPLGLLGPLGRDGWTPAAYVSGKKSVAWSEWAKELDDVEGPLSADGPLGSNGPLGAAYWETLPSINDFGEQLQAGGVWAVLGPTGPLGPLGALGPLGPIGAHGLSTDDAGNYVADDGSVVRTIDVPWDAETTRRYELFEEYDAEHARAMSDNDASFMASAWLSSSKVHEYAFASRDTQFVTVVVVPESASMFLPQAMSVLFAAAAIRFDTPAIAPVPSMTTDDFDLEILADGAPIAESTTDDMVDWVHVRVPKGKKLSARVTRKSTWDPFGVSPISGRYRIYVTGSTKHISKTSIRGGHQIKW